VTETQPSSPTVSVVMPTYNRAHLLQQVVESILSQDFEDLELVIVDDGSTDRTADVVRELQARDPRVRYVPLPQNRGVGFARDAGLRYARGKYIALADSDDLWLPGRLRAQAQCLQRYPQIDIIFGEFLNIDHVKGTQRLALANSPGLRDVTARPIEDDLFLVERGIEIGILRSNFIAAQTMVLRREIFDRVGGFNATLRMSEDLEFCWRAAVLGARYAYLDWPLLERHRRGDSLTTQGDRPHLDRLDAVKVMYQTCRRLGRRDLLKHVRATELRTYCNLLRIYGERGQRTAAMHVYMKSLRRGLSLRTLAWFLMALVGPRGMSWVLDVWKKHQGGSR